MNHSLAVSMLLAYGWRILPTSCSCGGNYAWLKPSALGGLEMVGCICHHAPLELIKNFTQPGDHHEQ